MSELITILSDDEDDKTAEIPKMSISSIDDPHKQLNGDKSSCPKNDTNRYIGFENFLEHCADIEVNKRGGRDSEPMNIVKRKLLSRYKEADQDYLKSEAFKNVIILATKKVENDPSRLFVHLKEVQDELKLRCAKKKFKNKKRNNAKSEDEPQIKRTKEESVLPVESNSENEVKINERHVQKLERLFNKVYRRVKKLEKKEVDWDKDEENSNYIKWSRFSKRICAIWEKLQEAKGSLEAAKRLKSRKIAFAGTPHPKLNQVIENYVNKTQKFPDFHDILKLTTETLSGNEKMTSDDLQKIATSAFQSLGNQLQKIRVYDFWNSFITYIPPEDEDKSDPAEKDEKLSKELKENQRIGEKKLNEVVQKFVDQQISQKLEPEEVPPEVDDEDYKSAEEDDEEEAEEEEEEKGESEDIIGLSSSSDESDKEGTTKSNIKSNHCENGDDGESTDINGDVESKETKEVVKVKDEEVLNSVKREVIKEEVGPVASCSFPMRRNKVEISDDDIVEISD